MAEASSAVAVTPQEGAGGVPPRPEGVVVDQTTPDETTSSVVAKTRTFEAREFRSDISQGINVEKGVETGKKPETVTISAETEERYTYFLKDYLTQLSNALERNPTLRKNKAAQLDIALLDALTSDGKPDAVKISAFFDKPQGWILATEAINKFTFQSQCALGFMSEITPQQEERKVTAEPITIEMGGRGALNKLRETIGTNLRKIRSINLLGPDIGGLIGLGAGFGTGSPEGVLTGISMGLVTGTAGQIGLTRVVESFTKRGTVLAIKPNIGMFEEIKADVDEKAYFQALTGIDLDHLQVNAARTGLEKIPNTVVASNVDPENMSSAIIQGINSRRAFFEALGVSGKKSDSTPEEPLLKAVAEVGGINYEQLGTTWGKEIIDEFKADRGGVRDLWGNAKEKFDPATNSWVANPDFDPFVGLDAVGNARRFAKARETVMIRHAVKYLTEQLHRGKRETQLGILTEKKQTLESEAEKTRRTKEATERKVKLQAKQAEVNASQDKVKAATEKQAALDTIGQKLYRDFALTMVTRTDFLTDVAAEIASSTDERNRLTTEITTAKENRADEIGTLISQYIVSRGILRPPPGNRNQALENDYQTAMVQARSDALEIAKARYDERISDLETRKAECITKLTSLNNSLKEYKTAQEAKVMAEKEVLDTAPKDLVETKRAYDSLITPAGGPPTITEDDLRKKTADELIAKATRPPYSLANRTPEQKAKLREMLIRAKTEARAREVEMYEQSPAAQQEIYKEITEAPLLGTPPTITEDNLLTMPEAQLMNFLLNPPYSWDPAEVANNLNALHQAQAEAQKKLLIRYRISLDEQAKDLEAQIKTQDQIIEKAGNVAQIKERLDLTTAVLERQGSIFTQALSIKTEPEKYVDVTQIARSDMTYSKAEKDARAPKGYYELMNMFFAYQDRADREEYFKRIYQFLPPKRLAELMSEKGLSDPTVPPLALEDILNSLKTEITRNEISDPELYFGFRDIIEQIGQEATVL